MSRITTPIQPFSDTFRREVVGMADSIEWWDRYRGEMERLVSEPRQFDQDSQRERIALVPAVVKASASLATNRWTYTCEPVEWDGANKKWITLSGTSTEYTAYNLAEMLNDASTALYGYDLTTSDYTLAVQAIPNDTPVLLAYDRKDDVYVFEAANELVVTCTAAADAMLVPTAYLPSSGSITTTSGSYAAVTSWGDATLIDPNVFTWTKTTGLLEAGAGDYRLQWQADVTTATSDSTVGIKAQSKIDSGSWTDIPGTAVVQELSALAANSVRVGGIGYVTVATGEQLDLRIVIARTAGAGTPTIASGSLTWEASQVST